MVGARSTAASTAARKSGQNDFRTEFGLVDKCVMLFFYARHPKHSNEIPAVILALKDNF